jgi:hypothetical protein
MSGTLLLSVVSLGKDAGEALPLDDFLPLLGPGGGGWIIPIQGTSQLEKLTRKVFFHGLWRLYGTGKHC